MSVNVKKSNTAFTKSSNVMVLLNIIERNLEDVIMAEPVIGTPVNILAKNVLSAIHGAKVTAKDLLAQFPISVK